MKLKNFRVQELKSGPAAVPEAIAKAIGGYCSLPLSFQKGGLFAVLESSEGDTITYLSPATLNASPPAVILGLLAQLHTQGQVA